MCKKRLRKLGGLHVMRNSKMSAVKQISLTTWHILIWSLYRWLQLLLTLLGTNLHFFECPRLYLPGETHIYIKATGGFLRSLNNPWGSLVLRAWVRCLEPGITMSEIFHLDTPGANKILQERATRSFQIVPLVLQDLNSQWDKGQIMNSDYLTFLFRSFVISSAMAVDVDYWVVFW